MNTREFQIYDNSNNNNNINNKREERVGMDWRIKESRGRLVGLVTMMSGYGRREETGCSWLMAACGGETRSG